MKDIRQVVAIAVAGLVFACYSACVIAQQVTGTPGSPNATTTLSGKQIPAPAAEFGGVISPGTWPPSSRRS